MTDLPTDPPTDRPPDAIASVEGPDDNALLAQSLAPRLLAAAAGGAVSWDRTRRGMVALVERRTTTSCATALLVYRQELGGTATCELWIDEATGRTILQVELTEAASGHLRAAVDAVAPAQAA